MTFTGSYKKKSVPVTVSSRFNLVIAYSELNASKKKSDSDLYMNSEKSKFSTFEGYP